MNIAKIKERVEQRIIEKEEERYVEVLYNLLKEKERNEEALVFINRQIQYFYTNPKRFMEEKGAVALTVAR